MLCPRSNRLTPACIPDPLLVWFIRAVQWPHPPEANPSQLNKTRYQEINLKLTRKHSPRYLASVDLEIALQAAGEERTSVALLTTGPYILQHQAVRQMASNGAVVV